MSQRRRARRRWRDHLRPARPCEFAVADSDELRVGVPRQRPHQRVAARSGAENRDQEGYSVIIEGDSEDGFDSDCEGGVGVGGR